MPWMLLLVWLSTVCRPDEATSPFQSVGISKSLISGYFCCMHSLNASERSRPLIEVRGPWNSTTLPLPLSDSPRYGHAFTPYARLWAARSMNRCLAAGRATQGGNPPCRWYPRRCCCSCCCTTRPAGRTRTGRRGGKYDAWQSQSFPYSGSGVGDLVRLPRRPDGETESYRV